MPTSRTIDALLSGASEKTSTHNNPLTTRSVSQNHGRSGSSPSGPPGSGSSRRRLQKSATSSSPADHHHSTSPFVPNPSFIRLLRLFLYSLSSLSGIVTAVFAILVVAFYNDHSPSIKPTWSSDIALIIFGLATPFLLFGSLLVAPRTVRRGGPWAPFVGQVKSELALLFSLAVIWVSGALAMAVDLRGYENCIWDGYYHWPTPTDFKHVCDLINTTVIMGYVTFGLVVLQWFLITTIAIYILLYLDQDVLTEPTHDMGGRAYRARILALQIAAAHRPAISEKPREREFDEKAPSSSAGPAGPMAGGRNVPHSPRRHGRTSSANSQGSGDAYEYDQERMASYARGGEAREAPRQAGNAADNGYLDFGYVEEGRNPFDEEVESSHIRGMP